MIELRSLGTLEIHDASGTDLCAELQPKQLAFLLYLVHPPRRFHRRDSLLALFWPELDPRRGRNALRQLLYHLRRVLGEDVLLGRGYEEIAATDHLWSDVVAFESALKANRIEDALDLYRGDFLVGFHVHHVAAEFEHWLRQEQARLRDEAVRGAMALAGREESNRNLSEAVRRIRQAARFDPDDETVVQRLIEVLRQLGDRTGAVRAYDAFARRSREEYDLEPTEETRDLVSAIRVEAGPEEETSDIKPEILEPLTTFIGRRRELAALEAMLMEPEARFLTLTGIGGSGKSRLALELACRVEERFDEGCARVGLGGVLDREGLFSAIARGTGLREYGTRESSEAVAEHLSNRKLLLLLDGFERVRAAGPEIARLLRSAPRLRILVTSRVPLKVAGERVFPVPPMSLPRGEGLAATREFPLDSEALALFVDRARSVRPGFRLTRRNVRAVCDICRRLDGLPLAIELAAARVRTLTPEAIAQRLEDRFAFLTNGPMDEPRRLQSLEAAVAWSYELLDEGERALFRRLGGRIPGSSATRVSS